MNGMQSHLILLSRFRVSSVLKPNTYITNLHMNSLLQSYTPGTRQVHTTITPLSNNSMARGVLTHLGIVWVAMVNHVGVHLEPPISSGGVQHQPFPVVNFKHCIWCSVPKPSDWLWGPKHTEVDLQVGWENPSYSSKSLKHAYVNNWTRLAWVVISFQRPFVVELTREWGWGLYLEFRALRL